jgi:hypothetical protein
MLKQPRMAKFIRGEESWASKTTGEDDERVKKIKQDVKLKIDEPTDYKRDHTKGWTGFKIAILENNEIIAKKEIIMTGNNADLQDALKKKFDIKGIANLLSIKEPEKNVLADEEIHIKPMREAIGKLKGIEGNLMIHCHLGLNRTPIGTYMYLVEQLNMEPKEAKEAINVALNMRGFGKTVETFSLDQKGSYKNEIEKIDAAYNQRHGIRSAASTPELENKRVTRSVTKAEAENKKSVEVLPEASTTLKYKAISRPVLVSEESPPLPKPQSAKKNEGNEIQRPPSPRND